MVSLGSPESPNHSSSRVSGLIRDIFSYNGNIMLAAVISLLLVILFVLLLHVYAKWFLANARHRSRRSVSVSQVLGPSRIHRFNTLMFDTDLTSTTPTKGLEPSAIASIPQFVYEAGDHDRRNELECVVCLSLFEEWEMGRKLPGCGHAFHVECIDMWLSCHSSCPICRGPVVLGNENKVGETNLVSDDVVTEEEVSDDVITEEVPSLRSSFTTDHQEPAAFEIIVIDVPNSGENESTGVAVMSGSLSSASSSLSSQAAASRAVTGCLCLCLCLSEESAEQG